MWTMQISSSALKKKGRNVVLNLAESFRIKCREKGWAGGKGLGVYCEHEDVKHESGFQRRVMDSGGMGRRELSSDGSGIRNLFF